MKDRSEFRDYGTGGIFRRGNIVWIRYYRNGEAFSESTHSTSEGKAKRMLRFRLAEIETGTFNPKRSKIRVSDLMDAALRDYEINQRKSIDDAKARWKLHLQPTFEHLLAANVTSDMLQKYVEKRLADEAKPATVNRELALLKRAFSLGMQSTPPKVRFMPHFPHLKEDNVRTGFIMDQQADKIGTECAKVGLWMSALFWTLFEFGFRISEALNLRVKQIDLMNRSINLKPGETKSGKGRTAIMTSRVFEFVKACIAGKGPDSYVFTRSDGKPVSDFRETWSKVTKAAGVPSLKVHDLRRSAIRRMLQRGIPQSTAMALSGHRTESVFRRYAIVAEQDLREAAAKLDANPNLATIQLQSGATTRKEHRPN